MSIKAILFDLDGTLLPMDQDVFIADYFKRLVGYLAGYGYDPKVLTQAVWTCTGVMINNGGAVTNEQAFWKAFTDILGPEVRRYEPELITFYRTEFQNVRFSCGFAPMAAPLVRALKEKGYSVILATNPLFPAIATHSRIRWAGLEPEDFSLITTYENSSCSKPNPDYYRQILQKTGLQAGECVMIGNDVEEDMIARELGMQVFLLTDCMINKQGTDISAYPHGGFPELEAYLNTIV